MNPAAEVFRKFLLLGATAFGGPTAHLAHFRAEFVERRRWLGDAEFAETVALCQALPGPTSSQAAFAIGHRHAGLPGAWAAWLGFTLPNAVLLGAFGCVLASHGEAAVPGWLLGLKSFAVAVVAWAIVGMARTLTPTVTRAALAAAVAAALLAATRAGTSSSLVCYLQPALIVGCGVIGCMTFRGRSAMSAAGAGGECTHRVPSTVAWAALCGFAALVLATGFVHSAPPVIQAAAACCDAGALVFGGGHVVLPLLEAPFTEHGWLTRHDVLSAYALAQATPGPLFTMTSYLGGAMQAPAGPLAAAGAAALLTAAVFLPGLLLVIAALPAWNRLRSGTGARAALVGASCAVVGILAASLIGTVVPEGIADGRGAAITAASFVLLLVRRVPVPAIAAMAAAFGWAFP